MKYFISFGYLFAALINLAPVIGVLGDVQLSLLYDVEVPSAEFSIMLRHRAITIAIVGGLLLIAVFKSNLRVLAGITGLISMISYVALIAMVSGENTALERVALVDVAAILVLSFAIFGQYWQDQQLLAE